MTVRGVIEDPGLKDTPPVLDYTGRITIDAVRHEFYPADLVTDRPVDQRQVVRISPDKVRRYELSGNEFVVTTSTPPRHRRRSSPGGATRGRSRVAGSRRPIDQRAIERDEART
jgi:hypothetical protein